jgi:hypothetical protein
MRRGLEDVTGRWLVEPFKGAGVLVLKGNGEEGKRGAEEVIGRQLFEGPEGGEPTEKQSSGAIGDARLRRGSARGRGRPRMWAGPEWAAQANRLAGQEWATSARWCLLAGVE